MIETTDPGLLYGRPKTIPTTLVTPIGGGAGVLFIFIKKAGCIQTRNDRLYPKYSIDSTVYNLVTVDNSRDFHTIRFEFKIRNQNNIKQHMDSYRSYNLMGTINITFSIK